MAPAPNEPGARRWRRPTRRRQRRRRRGRAAVVGAAVTAPGPRVVEPRAPPCGRIGATRRTHVRRHPPRRRPKAPPPHRHSAIRNSRGCFVRQYPNSRWSCSRAAAAVVHEAHRMARKRPRHQLFVHLVAAAPAETARKTGMGHQKSTPSGRGATGGDIRAPRATCRRPPTPDPAAPQGRAGTRARAPPRGLRPARSRPQHGDTQPAHRRGYVPYAGPSGDVSRTYGRGIRLPATITSRQTGQGAPSGAPPASTRCDRRGPTPTGRRCHRGYRPYPVASTGGPELQPIPGSSQGATAARSRFKAAKYYRVRDGGRCLQRSRAGGCCRSSSFLGTAKHRRSAGPDPRPTPDLRPTRTNGEDPHGREQLRNRAMPEFGCAR
ncbi:hypothetical protein EKD16_00805 [Streptomonospora litoralis]|uniref:Uncharacterized protein n=1 Tax=Streptomonospora litoralis TaxID=2498135 RepID=A0A4P6PYM3_9ACTN|nr:hypothetical protein EKD16_00805 [Streptomonospora litoralis]